MAESQQQGLCGFFCCCANVNCVCEDTASFSGLSILQFSVSLARSGNIITCVGPSYIPE